MISGPANRSLALCVVVAFAACGCASQSVMEAAPASSMAKPMGGAEGEALQRMLIKRASLTIAAADVNAAAKAAEALAKDAGGYVESTNTNDDGATLYLRVPSDKLDEVMGKLARLGKETNRNISADDVTGEVLDTEATLKNKKILRDRLRNLLDRAKDVQDVIAIEEQLTRVQSQIDSMESRLKNLRSRVAMSSIHFQVDKKKVLGPLGLVFWCLGWAIKKLFVLSG